MKKGRLLFFVLFITCVSLIYVHQRTQIIVNGYREKKILQENIILSNERRHLDYIKETMRSPIVLSNILWKDKENYVLSDNTNTFYIPVSSTRQMAEEKTIFNKVYSFIFPQTQAQDRR